MPLQFTLTHPERVICESKFAGIEYVITQGGALGSPCGYVYVAPDHPWCGKDYHDINTISRGEDEIVGIDNPLTFSEFDVLTDGTDSHNGYWIGFDCGNHHPALHKLCDLTYMIDECEKLIKQLRQFNPG